MKFDTSTHKKGMAYLAYKEPYNVVLIHPDEVFEQSPNVYRCLIDGSPHTFIDMTRIPENDRL
jgi:hypothetical protein